MPTAAPTDTPAPTAVPTRTLKKDSTGETLKAQQALIDLGYLADAADGAFGANTQEAVTRFQAVNGLSADGLAGTKTQELLYSGNALSADRAEARFPDSGQPSAQARQERRADRSGDD